MNIGRSEQRYMPVAAYFTSSENNLLSYRAELSRSRRKACRHVGSSMSGERRYQPTTRLHHYQSSDATGPQAFSTEINYY